ncbi:hypothetical protein [Acetobacterium fimetarium]|nr:hypothetical protein [Acetobacterium fimetarium]
MARQARVKSTTGIYHVMMKGLDGRNIFWMMPMLDLYGKTG